MSRGASRSTRAASALCGRREPRPHRRYHDGGAGDLLARQRGPARAPPRVDKGREPARIRSADSCAAVAAIRARRSAPPRPAAGRPSPRCSQTRGRGEAERRAPPVGDHLDRRAVERVQDIAAPPGHPVDRVLGRPDHADQPDRRPSSAIALIAASTAAAPTCRTLRRQRLLRLQRERHGSKVTPLPTRATSGPAASGGAERRTIS
jgi:hypothetical protein